MLLLLVVVAAAAVVGVACRYLVSRWGSFQAYFLVPATCLCCLVWALLMPSFASAVLLVWACLAAIGIECCVDPRGLPSQRHARSNAWVRVAMGLGCLALLADYGANIRAYDPDDIAASAAAAAAAAVAAAASASNATAAVVALQAAAAAGAVVRTPPPDGAQALATALAETLRLGLGLQFHPYAWLSLGSQVVLLFVMVSCDNWQRRLQHYSFAAEMGHLRNPANVAADGNNRAAAVAARSGAVPIAPGPAAANAAVSMPNGAPVSPTLAVNEESEDGLPLRRKPAPDTSSLASASSSGGGGGGGGGGKRRVAKEGMRVLCCGCGDRNNNNNHKKGRRPASGAATPEWLVTTLRFAFKNSALIFLCALCVRACVRA